MRQTATVTTKTASQDDTGQWYTTDGTTYTVPCNLQPASSSEMAIYKRETGRTLYTVYMMPNATDGTALASSVTHIATVTIDGTVYKCDGNAMDLCSNGAVLQVNVYADN